MLVVLAPSPAISQPAAAADTYPPAAASLTTSGGTVAPGGTVTLTAAGYAPGAVVTFTLQGPDLGLGTALADPDGVAALTVDLQDHLATGVYSIVVTSPGGPTQHLTITVSAVAGGADQAAGMVPPRTGPGPTSLLLRLAVVGFLIGGPLLLTAARRRRSPVADPPPP